MLSFSGKHLFLDGSKLNILGANIRLSKELQTWILKQLRPTISQYKNSTRILKSKEIVTNLHTLPFISLFGQSSGKCYMTKESPHDPKIIFNVLGISFQKVQVNNANHKTQNEFQ